MARRPAMWRVALDEGAFRSLVAGRTVAVRLSDGGQAEIILSDIGWPKILRAVLDGIALEPGLPKGPPDPPEAREFLPRSGRR
jgi:hypothetical protein